MIISPRLPLVVLALALLPAAALAQTPAAPTPAAQTPAKQFIPGLGIANRDQIVGNSNAFRNANSERQIVFKNQYAMAEARRKQINAEIEPLVKKFKDDLLIGSASEVELQQQARAIQSLQQTGVQELQGMLGPMTRSEAYVQEQISDVLSNAIVAAMDKRGVTVVVPPQNLLAFNNGYDLGADVLAALNTVLPKANVIPPDGWRPRAEREAAAAEAAQLAKPAPTKR